MRIAVARYTQTTQEIWRASEMACSAIRVVEPVVEIFEPGPPMTSKLPLGTAANNKSSICVVQIKRRPREPCRLRRSRRANKRRGFRCRKRAVTWPHLRHQLKMRSRAWLFSGFGWDKARCSATSRCLKRHPLPPTPYDGQTTSPILVVPEEERSSVRRLIQLTAPVATVDGEKQKKSTKIIGYVSPLTHVSL